MANRLVLVVLLLATATAHAQVMGAGGAPSAAAKAAPLKAAVFGPSLAASPLLSKAVVAERPALPRLPAPRSLPFPTNPRTETVVRGR